MIMALDGYSGLVLNSHMIRNPESSSAHDFPHGLRAIFAFSDLPAAKVVVTRGV